MAILTFQYLRELQKKERDSPVLQHIDANFYKAVAECLKESSDAETMLALAKSIFDMRERKIVSLALKSARADIKPENVLPEEEMLFLEVSRAVKRSREELDANMIKKDSVPKQENGVQAQEKAPEKAVPALTKVRAASDIPAFVGEDMKTYGPLKAGEIAEIPEKAAKILINSKTADILD